MPFFVKSGDLLSLFFFTCLWWVFFSFLFLFFVAQPHGCVLCIAFPTGLAVLPTQGFYFAFAFFVFVVFRKQICFGSEGVAKDKLVFGMLKHGHVSFQILT